MRKSTTSGPRKGLIAATALTAALLLAAVAIAADDPPSPTISGEPRVGETLTASQADLYKWQRCDPVAALCSADADMNDAGWTDITGAEGPEASTYTPITGDIGFMIRVLAKSTDLGSKYAASPPVGPVEGAVPPTNVTPPSISGEPIVGEILTGHDGTWDGDGLTFAHQWQRLTTSGTWEDIAGATGQTYTPTAADMNRRIRLRVVATGPGGDSDPAYSEPTDPVSNPPVFGESGNLDPQAGTVLAQLPGSDQVLRIEELTQVPLGTTVDVNGGFVDLTTQRGPGEALQTETLWDGAFVFGQRRKGRITVLRLTDSILTANSRIADAQASGRRHRRLWGRGRCRCRTRGRNSSGTARGTWWLTAERKRGTFTKVKEGAVLVRDFTRNKKVLVKAGHKHLAPNH
jgi:hypothetical protein